MCLQKIKESPELHSTGKSPGISNLEWVIAVYCQLDFLVSVRFCPEPQPRPAGCCIQDMCWVCQGNREAKYIDETKREAFMEGFHKQNIKYFLPKIGVELRELGSLWQNHPTWTNWWSGKKLEMIIWAWFRPAGKFGILKKAMLGLAFIQTTIGYSSLIWISHHTGDRRASLLRC